MATHPHKPILNFRGVVLRTLAISVAATLAACSGQGMKEAVDEPGLRKQNQSEYRQLLEEAYQLSFTLDFDRLRKAYVQSSEYNPYGGVKLEGLPEAYSSVESADFDGCLRNVDRVLKYNYMSLEAHMIGVVCSGQAGEFEREDLHRYMVEGLMTSIENSGDGKSQESAFQTISTSELRGFVRLKGLQVLDQSIVYDKQGIYDKMQVRDPESGEEYPLFFNVSQQFAQGSEGE
ncbi:DUF4919 domain-containing protein [Microbulbifer hydrolyticus]|uniref:DUF4919 domain-containing protein n=1 Tax=Microbulbifer hydrolyticus TaxID=48074 RepID=A0A6P1TAV9_9GAMM|nr:DUF4919 domain-containing protein [Microbulbifer hydrolyticus]MBB5210665.1 hypothetical protein [Microbulbifer hydrolyticus]QHQ38875.1 DUF4919 domain-containing protein [Microbulbifer hydrolyticus]